jgi:hypothetical protein
MYATTLADSVGTSRQDSNSLIPLLDVKYVQAEQMMQQMQAQQQSDDQIAAAAAAPIMPTEDDVREELLPLLLQAVSRQQQEGSGGVQHSLIAVTMLCMLPGYEARAVDFLLPAFQEFASKVC